MAPIKLQHKFSRDIANRLRARLEAQHTEVRVVERDLVHDKVPHRDQPTLKAMATHNPVEEESLKDALHLLDLLTQELLSSDLLVIASPM
jgi:FMN-dependent NADH-azoreductase